MKKEIITIAIILASINPVLAETKETSKKTTEPILVSLVKLPFYLINEWYSDSNPLSHTDISLLDIGLAAYGGYDCATKPSRCR